MADFVDLNLQWAYDLSTRINPGGTTLHYGGPSPWRGADRSSPEAFRDSTEHARCPSIVRAWHDFHRSKGWAGLAYSSCVCPHGTRYEGRGPGKRTGANGTNAGNDRSYAVCYIAGDSDPLTAEAKAACHLEARRLGLALEWVHSDWKATACPGEPIRAWHRQGFPYPGPTQPTPTEENSDMGATIIALYGHWRKDPDAAMQDFGGFLHWLKVGEERGEAEMAEILAGALAHEAGF